MKNTVSHQFQKEVNYVIENEVDVDLVNNDPLKSIFVHEKFLSMTKKIKIYARGLHAGIFNDDKVIDAFSSKVKSLLDSSRYNESDEPYIQLLVKETKQNLDKNLSNSTFYNKAQELAQQYGKNFLVINRIEPDESVELPYSVDIKYFDIVPYSKIKEYNRLIHAKDVNTFEVFDNKFIRIRTDKKRGHKSEAIVNCGKPKRDIQKLNTIFECLREKSHPYSLKGSS